MLKIYFRSIKENKLSTLQEFRKGAWIHAENPTEQEIEKIVAMTNCNEELVRDVLDEYEVPRLEIDNKISYVFTRIPYSCKNEISTTPMLITVGPDFVLTIVKEKLNIFEMLQKKIKNFKTTQKTKLFLEILSVVCNQYSGYLLRINKSVRGLRFQIKNINISDISKFVDLEKDLNDFLSALIPTNTALENILKRGQLPSYEEDIEFIEDLSVDFEQQIELTKSILKHAINIRDAYSNVMTHDLNRVMKILTALTIILTIPTMVFSFYGMNVELPFHTSPLASVYIILGTIVVSVMFFFVFVKNRWL